MPTTISEVPTTTMIPTANFDVPMATMSPCPASKFMENPYCSYLNIFLFTLYIILAAFGVGFTAWVTFTYLKREYNYAIQVKEEERKRKERRGREQARDLLRDLEAGSRTQTPLLAGDHTTNYGGTIATTILPRQRRPGVGVAAIGSIEQGAIAQRRLRRGSSLWRTMEPVVEEEEGEAEGGTGGGEMRFETV